MSKAQLPPPRRYFFFAWLSLVLMSSDLAGADCRIPSGPEFDFARVIVAQNARPLLKYLQMQDACESLNPKVNRTLAQARSEITKRGERLYFYEIDSQIQRTDEALSWRPGSSDIEKAYVQRLRGIAKISDPVRRMTEAYLAMNQFRGKYQPYEWDGLPSPGKTLLKAAKSGSGGVCRDFASLLTWSLHHVARGPAGHAHFSVHTKHIPRHALVTVRLFHSPGSRSEKDRLFSLDPTNYQRFTPLPVPDLRASTDTLLKRFESCSRVVRCLSEKAFREHKFGSAK